MTTAKNIGFIGAGKVGLALGLYFQKLHFSIKGYYSINFTDAQHAASLTHSTPFTSSKEIAEACNLLFLTVNDDNIAKVAEELSVLPIQNSDKKTVVHCSGAHTSELLKPLSKKGYHTASVHPLLAVSNSEKAAEILQNTFFTIEGDEKAIALFKDIFQQTNNSYKTLKAENKATYHLAAVMLSNYLVTLYHYSNELFSLAGLDEKANSALPLLESVMENLKNNDTVTALTGPIKRNDQETIKKHIETLTKKQPELLPLYSELGKQTAKMIGNNTIIDLFEQ